MANNLKQKFSRLFKKEPVPSELAQLEIKPDMKPVDVVDACVSFIKQNSENLDFDDTVMVTDYDNNTIYAMSRQKNGQYNYTKYFTDGKVIVGYYFSLQLSVFSFDTVYELRFLDDTTFTFSKEDTEPKVYQKVENLFNLLSKNYDKAEARRKAEREKLAQKELDNAVAYIKSHLGKTEAKNVNKEQKPMTHIDLIKACQELVNCPSVMVIGKQDNMPLMKQKTFEIMPKSEYELPLIFNFERNIFYYNDSDGSHTRYDLCIGPEDLDLFSTKNKFYFEDNGQLDEIIVEAKKLFDLCESKQTVLEKPLKKTMETKVEESVDKIRKIPTDKILFALWVMLAITVSYYTAKVVRSDKTDKHPKKEQVQKTLSNYLEQKQLFEQYRDSLTNSKIRQ